MLTDSSIIEASHPAAPHLEVRTLGGRLIERVTAIDPVGGRYRQIVERRPGRVALHPDGTMVERWVRAPFMVIDRRTGREWMGA